MNKKETKVQLKRKINYNLASKAHKCAADEKEKMDRATHGHHGAKSRAVGGYQFIPSSTYLILDAYAFMEWFKVPKKAIILDAGCGVSPFLMFLKEKNFSHLHGIDMEIDYLKRLKEILGDKPRDIKLSEGNLLTTDFSQYDFIYCFMPLSDRKLYHEFRNQAFRTMKLGAVITDSYGPLGGNIPSALKRTVTAYKRERVGMTDELLFTPYKNHDEYARIFVKTRL